MIKPETAHPAFAKAGHLFGVDMLDRPGRSGHDLQVDLDWVASHVDANTVALDRFGAQLRLRHGRPDSMNWARSPSSTTIGLHVDGCLGGFLLPFGRELGYDIAAFDFSVPGVTTISADTHKYGYALKGTSVLAFADQSLRNSQYFYLTDWSGGKYCSPGMDGSRSGGLLGRDLGRDGAPRSRGLPTLRQGRSSRRRPPCRRPICEPRVTAHHGQAELPLLLHLRRVRHLPGERLPAHARVGA